MQEPAVTKQGDFGTKVRLERGEIELSTDHSGMQRARVKSSSYVDEIRNKKYIDETQYQAAMQLYQDWYVGVCTRDNMPVMKYDVMPSKNNGGRKEVEYTDRQMQHWQAYHAAMKSLESLGKHIVDGVCCHNYTLAEIEKKLSLPRRFGMARLKESLNTLAVYYGLISNKQR